MKSSHQNRGLHLFLAFTTFMTFVLIMAGALVTSTDAGLAAPDWPLSYGQVMPKMVGNLRWEHGHRMIATSVGLLTLISTIWLVAREPRRWVRRVGLFALAAVSAQGILGGMTVIYMLPPAVSVSHACLAQIFFCTMISLTLFTSPKWPIWEAKHLSLEESVSPRLRYLASSATAAIFLQLILGATLRHKEVYVRGDYIKGVYVAPHLLIAHIAGALLVAFLIGWTVLTIFRHHANQPFLTRPAVIVLIIVGLQLFLGLAAYLTRLAARDDPQPLNPMVAVTIAHVAGGALTLAAQWVLTLRCSAQRLSAKESLQEERVTV